MVSVPKLWPGETFVCIGSGPSRTQADVDSVRGKARVIAINNNYRDVPWADVLYAADAKWWRDHKGATVFQGLKYSIEPSPDHQDQRLDRADQWNVHVLRNTGNEGLERDPSGLRTGMNSGYQAINLAVHLGATRILLLGYDMKAGPDRHHDRYHGLHGTRLTALPPYGLFRRHFETLVKPLRELGITVINCTPDTALTWFPRQALHLALAQAVAA